MTISEINKGNRAKSLRGAPAPCGAKVLRGIFVDVLSQTLSAAAGNLLQPAVLFFALGLIAAMARSDLALPRDAAKTLSLILMLCIGFKGGVEARAHGLDAGFLKAAGLGLALSFLLPLPAYALLRRTGLDTLTAAATAAHYGSVSVVTFAAAQSYLSSIGQAPGGYMSAVLALMETPGLLTAIAIAALTTRGVATGQDADRASAGKLAHEVLLNAASVVLIGGFLIGLITGEAGGERLKTFTGPVFQGVLCVFLLDLGVRAGRQLAAARGMNLGVLALGIVLPILGGVVALTLGWMAGLPAGDLAALAVLAASASYIAAPAAMSMALPKADAGVYLTLSLGVTFPFNLTIGIPLLAIAAARLAGG
ncbi:sodium-dependent bicarbonate transport family permease [Caulobacter vibrioides]|uniref:Sodium-dependent bicarbonate transport family permease n=1 Tax=Caulobacter vibrioides (strain ATCC 19089 / CIP 103742 / CB 15) TaxID=190650 RepID=Q9A2P7_CAUVC|nr:conserved hypothetical protein [Caulobacter vibrioides CB15]ATC30324.1 sodium-dependent bicarbonate transport family permease [Caulobacter vibrioides]AZH14500.1 sodium-dependent bicarbonate transport family permease [Caulobacter vibrioides]